MRGTLTGYARAVPYPQLGATYARVAELPVLVDRCELVPLVRDT